jgi:hypothetical protein
MVVLKEPFLGDEATISLVERQRCAIEFCVRLGKIGPETLQLIHQAYGVQISPPCDFWAFPTMKRELRGKKTAYSTIHLKLAANGLNHVFNKWVERFKKCIAC